MSSSLAPHADDAGTSRGSTVDAARFALDGVRQTVGVVAVAVLAVPVALLRVVAAVTVRAGGRSLVAAAAAAWAVMVTAPLAGVAGLGYP